MRRLLVLAAALAAGCSPAYVYKAWRGHSRLVSSQRPVESVLADPAAPAAERERLRLVQELRAFAFERMGFPLSKNYTGFAKIPGDAVTYVVTGSRRTRFEAKTWWFPVVGRVPYKGYFDRADAEAEAAGLEKDGWDAYVGGVAAYTALGWSRDPVLSNMLELPVGEMSELILHELSHTALFFKHQVDFNEAAATFFGEDGAEEFLSRRFGPDSRELSEYREGRKAQEERSRAMERLYEELDALYRGGETEAEKLLLRETVFARARAELGLKTVNNALVLSHRRYRYDLGDFRRAHAIHGRDWKQTLAFLRSLDKKRPREALKAALSSDGT